MIRFAWLFLLLAAAPFASGQDSLAALRQTAETASSDWEALAKGLEQKIVRMLPCDPNVRASVEAVSHASEARLGALSAYLKAEAAQAKNDTEAAKKALAAQAALAGGWSTERAEADQERTAIEGQIADLKESMRKRGSLAGAEKVLAEIANMVRARGLRSDDHAGRRDSIDRLLGSLVVGYRDRETALENESALLDAESAKWASYYAARLARAAIECAIINPAAGRKKLRQL